MSFNSFTLHKLVSDHGGDITLRKVTNSGAYNPATGSIDSSSTTDYTVKAYFYNYENGLLTGLDNISRGTRRVVISALGLAVEPDDEDQLVGEGDTVHIESVKTIYSGGTKICYVCLVKE